MERRLASSSVVGRVKCTAGLSSPARFWRWLVQFPVNFVAGAEGIPGYTACMQHLQTVFTQVGRAVRRWQLRQGSISSRASSHCCPAACKPLLLHPCRR